MEIIINNEKVDYRIEDEKNLGDILKGLESWITTNGGIIDGVSIDEDSIPLDFPTEYLEKNISSVKKLKIRTSPKFEHAINTIKSIGEYIIRIQDEGLDSHNIDYYEQILEGLHLISEGMESCLKALNLRDLVILNEKGKTLKEILTELRDLTSTYEKKYIDHEGSAQLKSVLSELLHILPKVVNWAAMKNSLCDNERSGLKVSFLKTALKDLEYIARRTSGKFEKIGENLQIGRDSEALNDLSYVTELLDEVIYLLQFFITAHIMENSFLDKSDISIEELFNSISKGLKQIEEAFVSGDLVTVGDLLEYEIKPLFEEMISLIHKISIFIQ